MNLIGPLGAFLTGSIVKEAAADRADAESTKTRLLETT
jgi:hypothetical protein